MLINSRLTCSKSILYKLQVTFFFTSRKASVKFSMKLTHGSAIFGLDQSPVSVCRTRSSNASDPVELGHELEQQNSGCQAEEDVVR